MLANTYEFSTFKLTFYSSMDLGSMLVTTILTLEIDASVCAGFKVSSFSKLHIRSQMRSSNFPDTFLMARKTYRGLSTAFPSCLQSFVIHFRHKRKPVIARATPPCAMSALVTPLSLTAIVLVADKDARRQYYDTVKR